MSDESNNEESNDKGMAITKDAVVMFHYRMCEVDKEGNKANWLEDSFGDSPVSYLHGYSNVIAGIEEVLSGKCQGDEVTTTVAPEQAYGVRQDVPVRRVPIKHLHEAGKKKKVFRPGDVVTVQTDQGPRNVTVLKSGKFNVDVDLNHPFAGRTLYYEVKILEVRTATDEEKSHGHAHGLGGHQH